MFDSNKNDYYSEIKIKGNDSSGTYGTFDKMLFDDISDELKAILGPKKITRLYDNDIINATVIHINAQGTLTL